MKKMISILFFYKKLFLPTLVVALVFGFLGIMSGHFSLKTVGISYILMSLFFHYLIYEVRYPNEYYFYYNMGLSKYFLWGISFALSLIIGLVLIIIE